MITPAILLRESLDRYAYKLRVSKDAFDMETYEEDYLNNNEWSTLELISKQLEPLFLLTKSLEGNIKLIKSASKPSHGALWEVLLVFKGLLQHFESLERKAALSRVLNNPSPWLGAKQKSTTLRLTFLLRGKLP